MTFLCYIRFFLVCFLSIVLGAVGLVGDGELVGLGGECGGHVGEIVGA